MPSEHDFFADDDVTSVPEASPVDAVPSPDETVEADAPESAEEPKVRLVRDPDFAPDAGDVAVAFPGSTAVSGADEHGRIVLGDPVEIPASVAAAAEGVAGVKVEAAD